MRFIPLLFFAAHLAVWQVVANAIKECEADYEQSESRPPWAARVPEEKPEFYRHYPVGHVLHRSDEFKVLDELGPNLKRINEEGDVGGVREARLQFPSGKVVNVAVKQFQIAKSEDYQSILLAETAAAKGYAKPGCHYEVYRMSDGTYRAYLYTARVGDGAKASGMWFTFPNALWHKLSPEQQRKVNERVDHIRSSGVHPDPIPTNVMWELDQNNHLHIWGIDWDKPDRRGEMQGYEEKLARRAALPDLDVLVDTTGLDIVDGKIPGPTGFGEPPEPTRRWGR